MTLIPSRMTHMLQNGCWSTKHHDLIRSYYRKEKGEGTDTSSNSMRHPRSLQTHWPQLTCIIISSCYNGASQRASFYSAAMRPAKNWVLFIWEKRGYDSLTGDCLCHRNSPLTKRNSLTQSEQPSFPSCSLHGLIHSYQMSVLLSIELFLFVECSSPTPQTLWPWVPLISLFRAHSWTMSIDTRHLYFKLVLLIILRKYTIQLIFLVWW